MALRGKNLSRGAELLGVDEDDVKTGRAANIRAGAAVLASLADEPARSTASRPRRVGPRDRRARGIADQVGAAISYIHHDVYA
jgi:hypothetical protein